MGLGLIEFGRLVSEPSTLVAERQRQQQQQQQQHSKVAIVGTCAGSGEGGGGFTFVIGSPVANPKALSKVAAELVVDQVCRRSRPEDDIRPGERLPKFDSLFSIESIRRAQPKPVSVVKTAVPSTHARASGTAAPPPPGRNSACTGSSFGGPPVGTSKFVSGHLG